MKNLRVARRYAMALMIAARDDEAVDQTTKDLEAVARLLENSREFQLLVESPVVSAQKKIQIFSELFSRSLGKDTLAFLHLVIEKQREKLLPDVIEQYKELRDKKQGIINVDVASAIEFSGGQEKALTEKLEQRTQKKVRLRFSLDKSLKGGLLVRIGDTVLDGSIKRQLERLKEQLIEGATQRTKVAH